jgi:hypothetical protein
MPEKSLILIHDFLQTMQTCCCVCLTNFWHKNVYTIDGTEKPHMNKYKEIMNDWNYDAKSPPTSLPASDFKEKLST